MSKNQTQKTETKVVTEKTNVTKINLQQFAEKLSKVEVKEKRKKETLYNYPEGFTEQKINSDEGKKFRNKLRNTIKRFCNNILLYAKHNRIEDLQKEVKEFVSFYKTNYRLNDFSIASISQSKNEVKENDLQTMIAIVKEVNK